MSETEGHGQAKRSGAARWLRHGGFLAVFATVLLVILGSGLVLGLTGRTLSVPNWVVARVEARVNDTLAGQASARIGGIDLLVDEKFAPHLRLRDAELYSSTGRRIATLPDVRATLRGRSLMSGRIAPRSLSLTGAQIALRRLADGNLDIALGGDASMSDTALDVGEVLNTIDQVFELPVLRDIEAIDVTNLYLSLNDARSAQVWTASDSWLKLGQDQRRVSIDLGFRLVQSGRDQGRAELHFTTVKSSSEASVLARISGVPARDLAAQSPALAWLAALDAPITGTVRSGIGADGQVRELQATLDIGAGALQPNPDTKPVRFDRARLDLTYDPTKGVLQFRDIAVDGPALQAQARGRAWLTFSTQGALPDALIAQIEFTEMKADPEGLFADPVAFDRGLLDFRLVLAPFRLDLGQLVLLDGARRIEARGRVTAEQSGWAVSLDSKINAIESRRLMALWPLSAVPKTREWLVANVATSEIFDVNAALRYVPGSEPRLSLGYKYRDTEVSILKTLPPVQNGAGYAVIEDNSYTLVVDSGHVTAPSGGDIDVAGSVLKIPDLRIKHAPARVVLKTKSTVTSALSLLDEPPFGFLSKAGLPVELAEGRAEVETILDLDLVEHIQPEDVDYIVTARLLDLRTDRIVPGRELTAGVLGLTATRSGIEISGPATLTGVPLDFVWRQKFGPANRGTSQVEGNVELSQRFFDAFGIGLSPDLVRGSDKGQFTLDVARDAPVGFRVVSDLRGLSMRLPGIEWSKPAGTGGHFAIRGRLGKQVEIDRVEIEAAGLKLAGDIRLTAAGGLDEIIFAEARMQDWFSGSVRLVGRGKGRSPAIEVMSGSLNLPAAKFAAVTGQTSDPPPITVGLGKVQLSNKIALTGFRGKFSTIGGLSGQFTGAVNDTAPVTGTLVPIDGQSAVRIRADDAGGVMRAAGIFQRGVGGALDLSLRPAGPPGHYNGTAKIRDIRVTGAPALAELLNAISVVGLINQLNGPGLQFTTVEGKFLLTPTAVEIQQGSAVGPSLGLSGAGVYNSQTDTVDLQGTISPLYLVNGIGQIFSRRGEGLFGFNYSLTGPASDPAVKVNPLSILTPGIFREIFRSDPAKLSQ